MITTLLLMSGVATAATPTPTPTQQALYDALVVRHDPPSCDSLTAMTPDPVTDLAWLVDHATAPAWVGMRAAQCLLTSHARASQATFEGWLATEGHRGLAILFTQQVDQLPLDVAQALSRSALAGPDRAEVERRLLDSDVPGIRELATE